MLYFRNKPDSVFLAIFHQALESELQGIRGISSKKNFDDWEAGYGNVCQHFTPYSALITIEHLLVSSRKDRVYRPGNYHWLLIYECLKNFCTLHDDLTSQERFNGVTIGEFRFHEIDFQGIVDLYFWDTDFLFLPEQESMPQVCGNLPNFDTLCQVSLTTDLQPHPRHLQLVPVEEPMWGLPQPQEFYEKYSYCYPDFH